MQFSKRTRPPFLIWGFFVFVAVLGLQTSGVAQIKEPSGVLGEETLQTNQRNMLKPAAAILTPGVSAEAGMWRQDPSGTFELDTDQGDTTVDVVDDLGLEREKNLFGRVQIKSPGGSFYSLGGHLVRFEGTKTLETSITVDGKTYSASDEVDSSLRIDYYDLRYGYKVSGGPITVEAFLQTNVVDMKAEVKNETTGETASESTTGVIPQLGATFATGVSETYEVYGEARGLSGQVSSISGKSYHYEAGLRYYIGNTPGAISIGYKKTGLEVDADVTELDLSWEGPFVSVQIKF